MISLNIIQLRRLTFITALFFLVVAPTWAQGVEMSEQQKEQAAQQLEQAKTRLDLTDEQALAVESILSNSFQERFIILDKYGIKPDDPDFKRPGMSTMRKMRKEMDRLDKDVKSQLENHLTKDQMKTFDQMEQERKDRMRERMRG